MVRLIKTGDNIVISCPEVDFSVPLIKFNSAPTTNNSNTEYLTRNTGTGNIEKVTSLPTIYNTNGNIAANRTVTNVGTNNLTFANSDATATFSLSAWNTISLSSLTVTSTSGGNTTISAGGLASVNGNVLLNLGTTSTTTTISSNTRTLNIDSSTTKLNNITIQPGGLGAGEFVFLDKVTKQIRCENIPTSFGSQSIISVAAGPLLTSIAPVSVDGPDVSLAAAFNYMFQASGTSGLQYNTALGGGATTFFVKYFAIEFGGFYTGSVDQEYSVGILINGSLDALSQSQFTYSGTTYLQFSTKKYITQLNNGDIIRVAFGRNDTDANISFNGNLIITPVAYY